MKRILDEHATEGDSMQHSMSRALNGAGLRLRVGALRGAQPVHFLHGDGPGDTASRGAQIAFGASVAVTYGMLMSLRVVFGLFFSLTMVTALRGVCSMRRSGEQPPPSSAMS